MKAAVLIEPEKLEIREIPEPKLRDGEVLIRMQGAGICGTDYAKYKGYLNGNFPVVAGHEGVGEIAALGVGVEGLEVGERVAIQPNFACGKCPTCLSGRENICPHRVRLGLDVNGVFAEYVTAPAKYVWKLPEGLPWTTAALTEPLSVVLHGIKRIPSLPGDGVLVYGTGAIGLLYVQLAVLNKAEVTAFNTSEPRLEAARKMGAANRFHSLKELKAQAGSFTVVYETSGAASALADIIELAAPGAGILLTGLPDGQATIPSAMIARKELRIEGAMTYTNEFGEAIEMLRKGLVSADAMITGIYGLEELPGVLADFRTPTRIKDLVRINNRD